MKQPFLYAFRGTSDTIRDHMSTSSLSSGKVYGWQRNLMNMLLADSGRQNNLLIWDLRRRPMAEESKIERIETVHKKPIMYYRPNQPDGGDYVKVRPVYTPIPDTSGGATLLLGRGFSHSTW